MDNRNDHRDTIRQDIDIVRDNELALKNALAEADVVHRTHNHLSNITHGYLNIIKALKAITDRNHGILESENIQLKQKLDALQTDDADIVRRRRKDD